MREIWKDIPGYEGKYQASTEGRIRSVERKVKGRCHFTGGVFERTVKGKVLSPGKYCKTGHLSVVLGHGTVGKPVHQLILLTFEGKPKDGREVLHINGNPSDNRLSNLRYGTRTENILDVYMQGGKWRKLSIDDVYLIRFYILCGFSGTYIADAFRVSKTTISDIKNRRIYKWLE